METTAETTSGPRTPKTLGKYPVIGQLGKGAMGVVYKSFDPIIRRPVALKTIRKELLDEEEDAATFGARFRNEAQAAGRLLHPGIVAVYEYGEDAQYAFIAMEFVEGSTLRQYFERKVPFEVRDVVSIMAQLLDALQYAHEQGVWHRDIKPANIIIMSNGRVKIADFGIARLDSSTLTQVGVLMGTPGFIAPEQYLGKQVDHRIDLFAAGAVMYELLAGKAPFGGSKEGVMYKVCHEAPCPPSEVSAKPPLARFDRVALRALAKSPDERYPSAAEFRAELLASYDRPFSPTVSETTLIQAAAGAGTGARESGEGTPSAGARPATPVPHAKAHYISTVPTELLIAGGWKVEELATVEHDLALFLGPIARVMVKRAAREAKDFASLVNQLAEKIPSEAQRAKFMRLCAPLVAAGTGPSHVAALDDQATVLPNTPAPVPAPGPTAEEIDRAARLLTVYLGPIAKVLVKQFAKPDVTRAQFLASLAGRIANPGDREHFVRDFEAKR